jgi:xanthine dehydrogenase molybdopterin-binding subunit B
MYIFDLITRYYFEYKIIELVYFVISLLFLYLGEAVYCNDIPPRSDELYLAIKTSIHAHAKIIKIDYTEALSCCGVVTIVDEKDLPGNRNMVGIMPVKDDYVFAREKVFKININLIFQT